MTATRAHRPMARPGPAAIAIAVSCVAAPGTPFLSSSALPTAAGTLSPAGSKSSVSASGGRLCPNLITSFGGLSLVGVWRHQPFVCSSLDGGVVLFCRLGRAWLRSAHVKLFGRRPHEGRAPRTGAGVRKAARDEAEVAERPGIVCLLGESGRALLRLTEMFALLGSTTYCLSYKETVVPAR